MTVTKIARNDWLAKFTITVNGTRIYRSRHFGTKAEAETYESNERYELTHPQESRQQVPFADYAENYVNLYKSQGSPRTYALYLGTVAKIRDRFGDRLISDISKDELQIWLNDFGQNHAITTGEKLYRQLHVILTAAVDDGIIPRNISKGLRFSGSEPQSPDEKYLEYADYITILHYLRDSASFDRVTEAMMYFALVTGARYGEVAGMTWDDIDFKKATININKQWFPKRHRFGKTKNNGKSDRIISIPPQALPVFKTLRKVQSLYLQNLHHDNIHNLMFLGQNFEVPQNDSVNDRLHDICTQLGIKKISMHGMRHTHATRLIYAQYSDWYIARRLGHGSLTELHRTYGHVFGQMQAENDTRLKESIGNDIVGESHTSIVHLPN
ncbi:tyrosine-type recombinase/integrase [Lacticaseibacillus pantheris]|uniref:tyrosine-type recombinase/integrase n=1 Tax=Lacticaseibacillus pantheris TaxID=171523 RepID=UPI00265B053A|nr:site-specific integrase [Lacticaseibacillus pantheris]WKF85991.1 site-specific integrase [Lacticaseibacillus pantheris]